MRRPCRPGWPGADTLIGGTVKHGMVWVFPEPPPPARCEGCGRFWDRRQAFSDDGLGPCCGVVPACNLPVVDGSPQGSPCQLRAEHAGRCQARTWGEGTR